MCLCFIDSKFVLNFCDIIFLITDPIIKNVYRAYSFTFNLATLHVKLKNAVRAIFLQKTQIALQGHSEGRRRASGRQWGVF